MAKISHKWAKARTGPPEVPSVSLMATISQTLATCPIRPSSSCPSLHSRRHSPARTSTGEAPFGSSEAPTSLSRTLSLFPSQVYMLEFQELSKED